MDRDSGRYARAIGVQNVTAVPLAVVQVVKRDTNRCGLLITNSGANPVTLSLNPDVTAGNGVKLSAPGASGTNSIQLWRSDFGRLLDGPIYAIAETGASILSVWESVEA